MRSGKLCDGLSAISVAGVVIVALVWSCAPERQLPGQVYRTVEPRLTGFAYQPCVVARSKRELVEVSRWPPYALVSSDCEDEAVGQNRELSHKRPGMVSSSTEDPSELTAEYWEALRELVESRGSTSGTDKAIEMLELEAHKFPHTARIQSDLAAAYLIRAGRQKRASDVARGYGLAVEATEIDDALPAARFNRALLEEQLPFAEEAASSWRRYLQLDASSPWAAEARQHLQRLQNALSTTESRDPICRELGEQAETATDAQLEMLVQVRIGVAQDCVLEELLPKWAITDPDNPGLSPRALVQATRLAEAIRAVNGDAFLVKTVEHIHGVLADARGDLLADLRMGLCLYSKALTRAPRASRGDSRQYLKEARICLERAHSPLRWQVDIKIAWDRFRDESLSMAQLEDLEKQSEIRTHRSLWQQFQALRAHARFFKNDLLASLADFDEAIKLSIALQDADEYAYLLPRRAGVYRVMGMPDRAWGDIFGLLHDRWRVDLDKRAYLLFEAALVAGDLDQRRLAMNLQDRAIRLLERDEARSPAQLAVAYRVRLHLCGDELKLGERLASLQCSKEDRQRYLDLASRAVKVVPEERDRRGLEARLLEARGRNALLDGDRAAAIEDFSESLRLLPEGEFYTLIADILLSRAIARLDAGEEGLAREDLRCSIETLKREESESLKNHDALIGEEGLGLWSSYFARFQHAYERLIGLLVDDGSDAALAEAYAYSEWSRAYEPRYLLLRASGRPDLVEELIESDDPPDLQSILKRIPADTAIVEYEILENSVLVWILWQDGSFFEELPTTRDVVADWVYQLQSALQARDLEQFAKLLKPPARALLGPVLRVLRDRRLDIERLVFIPDGPLHALPFAALETEPDRYLIESYTISTAPSAQLFLDAVDRDRKLVRPHTPSVLLVADPAFDPESELARGLTRLPAAHKEAAEIAEMYKAKAEVAILPDAEAGVQRLLELGKKSHIVHLAAHAVANPQFSDRSYLLLAPSEGRHGEITAAELVSGNSFSTARLVVLSACETAGGRTPIGPLGVAALVRPFLGSGVPAVVGSLWSVGDQGTKPLMTAFHRQVCLGQDAATALRAAQRELLSKGGALNSPAVWAGFQVVGYASSPFLQSTFDPARCTP